jgi:PBSX family phage portal protein
MHEDATVSATALQETSTKGNDTNKRAVRAIVVGTQKALAQQESTPGRSKELEEDPFKVLTEAGRLISPPFDMLTLAMLPEHNTELNQCIEAMEVNIEGFGHRFVPRVNLDGTAEEFGVSGEAFEEMRKQVRLERVQLENFFLYASMRESFISTRRKLRRDLETTGNGYLEVIRAANGKIQGFNHLPSYQMRLGRLDAEQALVKIPILELQPDGSTEVATIQSWERFRLFAQSRSLRSTHSRTVSIGGHKIRWFKEFGDPRHYNCDTGEVETSEKSVPEDKRANEVLHFKIYSPRSPYGLPRFIGNLLSIFGDRASEEINYTTFRNNNIPSMLLMVSNGQLTQGTVDRITDFVESQIQGSENYSKFLIIEAEGEDDGEDISPVKIDAKPLTEVQQKDALFQNYSENNQDKVRRAFRLPPILVGRAQDYTRTTAETSRRVADEQIFAPERDEFDSTMNRRIFPVMGVVYHSYKSNSPNTTDNQELVKMLSGAEKTGGMTPRIARRMLEDVLGQELPPLPLKSDTFDPDQPFSLSMAEAVKNKADPTEPGQQVTAEKTIDLIEKLTTGDLSDGDEEQLALVAMQTQRHFEKRWRASVKKQLDAE